MSARTLLMVGTRKGLWIGTSDRDRTDWQWSGPHCDMEEVYSCMVDTRGPTPRLLVGASSMWLGPQIRHSEDLGASWDETPGGAIGFPADTGETLARVWQLVPGAVFCSTDGGAHFSLDRGLWEHPQRSEWAAGFGGQAFHTVLPHPDDPESVTAALSTGGVYQTTDGGRSWAPRNRGIRADFFPEEQRYPDFGHCVHKVARHASRPDTLFLQNHGGVYRSTDHASSWDSIGDSLPSDFGFPIVVHPHDPDTVYVFPLGGGDGRYPPGGRPRVWRSRDAGESWKPLDQGLPESFYVGVMRDAMCTDTADPCGVYFGSRDGHVFASHDEGESWGVVAQHLPDVLCVRAASLD